MIISNLNGGGGRLLRSVLCRLLRKFGYLIPDEYYLRFLYRINMGVKLNLDNPQTLNEKLQWLKIHDRNPLYTVLVDKFLMRDYITQKIGQSYLIPLLGVWDRVEDIDFNSLPNQFVLKCNHNSGLGMYICKDKSALDIQTVKEKLQQGLNQDYYKTNREWPYKNVPRKIICEQYMVDDSGIELKDYKIFCFNGKPEYVEVDFNRAVEHKLNPYDFDWNPLYFCDDSKNDYNADIKRPKSLDRMREIAAELSQVAPFMRVDFYEIDGKPYIGELTLYPGAGFIKFNPKETDFKYGRLLDLTIQPKKYLRIADRVESIEPSLARRLFNMANNYNDVIDLTLGDPDFNAPEHIKNAMIKAIQDNQTHYSANSGIIEARQAIANHIQQVWGRSCDANSEIMVTVGGMEALFISLATIINPGDEVIIFAPYYVNYVQMTKMLGGKTVVLNSYDVDKGMVIDQALLMSSITDKTKAIIVNTPSNPTGGCFSRETLQGIAQIAVEKNLIIISDEVYRTLIFDDVEHQSILQFDSVVGQTILIDCLSKEFSMTGIRAGYIYAPKYIINAMIKLQENIVACASVPSQYAFVEAYNNYVDNKDMTDELRERRDYLYMELSKINKIKCSKPQATFYMFVNIEETGMDSMEFAYKLLEQEHIAVVPGITYGSAYNGYIRIAFTKNINVLQQAVSKLNHFLQ